MALKPLHSPLGYILRCNLQLFCLHLTYCVYSCLVKTWYLLDLVAIRFKKYLPCQIMALLVSLCVQSYCLLCWWEVAATRWNTGTVDTFGIVLLNRHKDSVFFFWFSLLGYFMLHKNYVDQQGKQKQGKLLSLALVLVLPAVLPFGSIACWMMHTWMISLGSITYVKRLGQIRISNSL